MTHTLFAPLHPGQLPTASAYGDAIEFLAGPKSLHVTGINLPLDQVGCMTYSACRGPLPLCAPIVTCTDGEAETQGWAAGAFNMPG